MSPSAKASTLQQTLVGGPLIGSRRRHHASNFSPWEQFEPIITPEVPLDKRQRQRFVLLPHPQYITVLAYKTGAQIATLVPFMNKDEAQNENPVIIESVCMVKQERKVSETSTQDIIDSMNMDEGSDQDDAPIEQNLEEVLVLVGCRDGTVREFSLKCLEASSTSGSVKCGSSFIDGPWHSPRRKIQVSKSESIIHITSPNITRASDTGILAFVAVKSNGLDGDDTTNTPSQRSTHTSVSVLRVLLPHFDNSDDISITKRDKEDVQRKWHLDKFKCRVGRDKSGAFIDTMPFRFVSVAKPLTSGHAVYAVLARANSIHVYYDRGTSMYPALSFSTPQENPISALDVSVNQSDIACGHYFGQISVLNDMLRKVEEFHLSSSRSASEKSPVARIDDPAIKYVTSKVHWHAHPVSSLVYDSMSSPLDPILYTGGEESVLVSWQVAQGKSKPVHVLPRVALGAIVHVACTDRSDDQPGNGILVFSKDNSLQLFESHNKGRSWKIQGLACQLGAETDSPSSEVSIQMDPRAQGDRDALLVLSGLNGAPGFLQWYDPLKQRISTSLEVAPFNRVSKTESSESEMPIPSLSTFEFTSAGKDLITVDEVATENTFIGAQIDEGSDRKYGIVTTIRFWTWNDTPSVGKASTARAPYNLVAAMTYPHGPKNRVSALATSLDGTMACTVSSDERAFRLWEKTMSGEGDSVRLPAWTCRFKVSSPAGFSNFKTKRDAVSFSQDGSTLAIAYGHAVAFWDSDEARFLSSVRHLEVTQGTIDSTDFVNLNKIQDLVLIRSEDGVSLQSPFGPQSGFKGWNWGISSNAKHARVTNARLVENQDVVAISVFDSSTSKTTIMFIDAETGVPVNDAVEAVGGCVSAMAVAGKREVQSKWEKAAVDSDLSLKLFTLTSSGRLLLIGPSTNNDPSALWKDSLLSHGPTLDVGANPSKSRRRKREEFSSQPMESVVKRTAVEVFGLTANEGAKSASTLTSELPSLSGNFVRSFVGRRLLRNKGQGHNQ